MEHGTLELHTIDSHLSMLCSSFSHPDAQRYRQDRSIDGHCETVARSFTLHAREHGLHAFTVDIAHASVKDAHTATLLHTAEGLLVVDFTARQCDKSLPVPIVYRPPADRFGWFEHRWGQLRQWETRHELPLGI